MNLPNFQDLSVPACVQNYPSMITTPEKSLLYWLASEYFTGTGIIVDAGIFLGASTNAFATGLDKNNHVLTAFGKPIRSYDIAIWVDSMDRYLENANVSDVLVDETVSSGQSFEPILRRLLDQHISKVDLRIGNIVDTAYSDDPVEIAFFDCLKTDERDLAVFKAFAPQYIPNQTIVLQQDYFYESAAYNKIRQEYFSEYFEYLGQVSTTAVFKNIGKIPHSEIASNPVAKLSVAQKIGYLRQAVKRAENNKTRVLTHLSIVEFLIDENEKTLAAEFLTSIEQEMSTLSLDEITRRPENIVSGFRKRLGEL